MYQVNQLLHDEHMAVIALLERLETFLNGISAADRPDMEDGQTNRLLIELIAEIEGSITDHFAFEEDKLFGPLDDDGYDDLTAILREEHAEILPLGKRVAGLARAGLANQFSNGEWPEFRRLALDFAHQLTDHASKEEISLLPAVEETIDIDADVALAGGYRH